MAKPRIEVHLNVVVEVNRIASDGNGTKIVDGTRMEGCGTRIGMEERGELKQKDMVLELGWKSWEPRQRHPDQL
ncbi:hypothetical protein R1flu_003908 [Riccia fluitans]|uniref:Uncharacterized protein n=1 Tax=Riccia fluitans TaxID=41844 RepID=A0ABD1YAI4_9MARC